MPRRGGRGREAPRRPSGSTRRTMTTTTDSRATRSSLSVLRNTAADPTESDKNFRERRERVSNQIHGGSVTHPTLWELFFEESHEEALQLARLARPIIHSGVRWTGMRLDPQNELEVALDFRKILDQLRKLWVGKYPHKNRPQLLLKDTQKTDIPDDRHPQRTLSPDLFFEGTGSLFAEYAKNASAPTWFLCAAVGDAKINVENQRWENYSQLATYAEQIFSAQENRRFVYAFNIDPNLIRPFIFDRGGAVCGGSVDYHNDPWKLCAIVVKMIFGDPEAMGLDRSVSFEGDLTIIRTTPPPDQPELPLNDHACEGTFIPLIKYVVVKTLLHNTNIRGSGTIYWLARRLKDQATGYEEPEMSFGDEWYIIKDTWVVGGCAHERTLYAQIYGLERAVQDVSHQGGVWMDPPGIAPLVLTHDVYSERQLDSVSNNRPMGVATPPADDRIHTRAIFRTTPGAKLLDGFSNTRELLIALYDAVKGHRSLHRRGVLHGNITPTRILIQPDAEPGNRGVLLDFDSAIDIESRTHIPRPVISNEDRTFYSREALSAIDKGLEYELSYFDDLHSFYYVLCYLVVCHPASGSLKPEVPKAIAYWFQEDGGYHSKSSTLLDESPSFDVHPSFKPPVSRLIKDLHTFFRDRTRQIYDVPPEPEDDYKVFLELIKNTIDALSEDGTTVARDVSSVPQGSGFIAKTNPGTADHLGTTLNPSNISCKATSVSQDEMNVLWHLESLQAVLSRGKIVRNSYSEDNGIGGVDNTDRSSELRRGRGRHRTPSPTPGPSKHLKPNHSLH
ncbi:hypothetical protein K439DRAFT_1616568 [Ramaria rubella]|nr:hypothetical protein K439DRAFT_1616568 [Ramaria rubella]